MLVTTGDEVRRARTEDIAFRSYLRHWVCFSALAAADIVALTLGGAIMRLFQPQAIGVFTSFSIFFVCIRGISGDYSLRGPFWDRLRGIYVVLLAGTLAILVRTRLQSHPLSVGGAISSWIALATAIPFLRQGTRSVLAFFGLWQRKTALIGCGPAAEIAYQTFHNSLSMGFDIQWLVTLDPKVEVRTALLQLDHMVVESPEDMARFVREAKCEQAVVALSESEQKFIPDIVRRLNEADVQTAIIPAVGGLPMGSLTAHVLFGRNILLFQTRDNLRRWPQRALKRTFDVIAAALGLTALSPLFFVMAALIHRDGGPVFYSQARIGRDGNPFRCIKFRTMSADADERLERWRKENPDLYEEYLRSFKLRDDPRVTPLGNFLRRTSIDELPQLINVLRGEMSFVGPRPVVERELIDHYGPAARLYMRVRPGLTGLWQISGRSDTTYEERIAFDEWYILNWSFWYDLIIIAQTFPIVAMGQGAR